MIARLLYRGLSTLVAFAAVLALVVAVDARGAAAFLAAAVLVGAALWAVEHALGLDAWKRGRR